MYKDILVEIDGPPYEVSGGNTWSLRVAGGQNLDMYIYRDFITKAFEIRLPRYIKPEELSTYASALLAIDTYIREVLSGA